MIESADAQAGQEQADESQPDGTTEIEANPIAEGDRATPSADDEETERQPRVDATTEPQPDDVPAIASQPDVDPARPPRPDVDPSHDVQPAETTYEDEPPLDTNLDHLCAAVTSTARVARGRSLFVGWTAQALPAATTRLTELTDNARAMLTAFHSSGLPPRQIPYAAVVPVTYVLTGPAVDFADHARRRAEDQIRYKVLDAVGERRDLALGERTVLGAIVAARTPWQATAERMAVTHAVSAVPMYTVFLPLPGASVDTGLALLFEPTVRGSSNEPAMRSFVRHSIGRLLVLDESQPAKSRKGYLEAAGKLAGTLPQGGSMSSLVALRRMGLVDFDDNWLTGLDMAKRRTKGRFIQALRGLGMVEISDEMLDELKHPRPDYDVDQLDMDKLFDLAEAMYAVANRLLSPPPKAQSAKSSRRGRR